MAAKRQPWRTCTWVKHMGHVRRAKFRVGQVVRHRALSFSRHHFRHRSDFQNTEEWWQAIPEEARPRKDQPFYHLLAENAETEYIAYVSEQNLLPDSSGDPAAPPAGARDVRAREKTAPTGPCSCNTRTERAGDVRSNGKRLPLRAGRSSRYASARAVTSLPAAAARRSPAALTGGTIVLGGLLLLYSSIISCWRWAICCISERRASLYFCVSTGGPA